MVLLDAVMHAVMQCVQSVAGPASVASHVRGPPHASGEDLKTAAAQPSLVRGSLQLSKRPTTKSRRTDARGHRSELMAK